jgi:hypothetical protein
MQYITLVFKTMADRVSLRMQYITLVFKTMADILLSTMGLPQVRDNTSNPGGSCPVPAQVYSHTATKVQNFSEPEMNQ